MNTSLQKLSLNKTNLCALVYISMALVLSQVFAIIALTQSASAAQITNRKVTLSNSAGAATGVSYAFTSSALPTSTAVRSVAFQACTTSSGACSTPSGFSSASSTLASQPSGLGAASSWTVNTAVTGSLRITHASNVTAPSGSVSIQWNSVANPTADNSLFFLRGTTYSDAAWTTPIDTGVVAVSTAEQISLSGSVDEALTFCTGTSITGTNCGTASGSSINFGTFSTSAATTATSVMAASTNASSGYAITVNGTTLTSGGNTIDAMATQDTSTTDSEQFGLNLVDNASPNVGANPGGTGTGDAVGDYDDADNFKFVTGETVASAAGSTDANSFTVSYLVNIGGSTEAGVYTSTMTYICTATF